MEHQITEKKKGITGSTLKLIAIIAMLIDHIGAVVLEHGMNANGLQQAALSDEAMDLWMQQHATEYLIYLACRMIGRVAFPIFCFLLVEGFVHTGNIWKYQLRLWIFALVSEIPFDLAVFGMPLEFSYQNVFFTLGIGLMTITAIKRFAEPITSSMAKRYLKTFAIAAVGCFIAHLLNTDYGAFGILAIVVFYELRDDKKLQTLLSAFMFVIHEIPTVAFGFIPIYFYNGERGLRIKYFFYIFYPAHLLVLYFISRALGYMA